MVATNCSAWFDERGPRTHVHHIQLCATDGDAWLLEGVGVEPSSGEAFATFAASVQLDDDGLISRYLSFMTAPSVEPAPGRNGMTTEAAADVLRRYFDALDSGAFEEAADQFSIDVVYSHPPYRHTGIDGNERVVFRGRDELLAAFKKRGQQSFDHRVLAIAQRGRHCVLEGVVEGLPDDRNGSFISSLTLDGNGLIERYVSFYCEPAVEPDDRAAVRPRRRRWRHGRPHRRRTRRSRRRGDRAGRARHRARGLGALRGLPLDGAVG